MAIVTPPPPQPERLDGAALASLAGQKLGNYRLEQVVGRGRMGVVYRATDEALLRPTAVKVLSWPTSEAGGQDPVRWFLAEARLVARINHPQVVQIYGVARQGPLCYIAMEYVAGESAEALVGRSGALPPAEATDLLVQAAAALQAAHASGVVHRDVKPGNLLVGPGRVVKLGDFGMALGPPDVRIGNAHLRVGTPFYAAPEVWRGEPSGVASDLYALGATYFQLLTGRPPYRSATSAQVEQDHLRAPVPDPRAIRPDVPAACAVLAMQALAKSPADRPASAAAMAAEGLRILAALGVAPSGATASPPAANPPRPAAQKDPGAPPPRPPPDERPDRMIPLKWYLTHPEVRSAVLGDLGGQVLESAQEADAEAIAAVSGFVAAELSSAGATMGLGRLLRIGIGGERAATLLVVDGERVAALQLKAPRAMPAVEKHVEHAQAGKG